jgi:predicted dehydrogenase
MNKVRWGIISTANIGVKKVIPAMQAGKYCEVTALASRDYAKGQEVADSLGIPKVYGSYEELLNDPEIEAIYNPLPNHLHVSWSIKALEAGKHVLCEKPIGLSAEEGQQLVSAAKQHPHLKVMEAFMYRHHPQWQLARRLVQEGKIGELKTVQSFFSYYLADPNNVRNVAEYGGGGLMDIGCYPISLSRFIFDAEPEQVSGSMTYHPEFKTDVLASAILDFGGGKAATFTCSTQLAPYQRVNIFGTKGRIELEIPFNAPNDRPCKVWHQQGGDTQEILLEVCDQYTIQGDLFAQAILNNTPVPTPIEDAVANMRVIEALIKSANQSKFEKV